MDILLIVKIVVATALFILLYFTLYIIGRNKRDSTGIFVVNLLLGWSLIGWLVAFIWSFVSPKAALWSYKCPNCNFINGLDQRSSLLVCKQCGKETKVVSKNV
jgi:hypothetical protein